MLPMYNSKSTSDITSAPSAQELETEILNAQKRALIIEIIKPVVMMKNNKLNENIKTLVAHTNIQIKAFT